jgi:OOP family OmpA-OmpF porin
MIALLLSYYLNYYPTRIPPKHMKSYSCFSLLCLLLCCAFVSPVQSQDSVLVDVPAQAYPASSWEVGLLLGAANAYGDLIDSRLIQFRRTKLAYGALARYNVTSNLSFRATYLRGQLEGADEDWESLADRGLRFESTINEGAIVGQWNFGKYQKPGSVGMSIRPYVFAGLGVVLTDLQSDFSSTVGNPRLEALAQQDMANSKTTHFMLPLGVGATVDLSDQISLSIEYGLRPVFNDYLDGVSVMGNPDRNDWYSMATASLAYRFPEQQQDQNQDQDQDGIVDRNDQCPKEWGTPQNMGCPDSDGDGVVDHVDQCPRVAGSAMAQGCPDQDGDGVPDSVDKCPRSPGAKTADGCADADLDGIPDSEDRCVTVPGTAEFEGCRDTDNDGVPDPDDRCPYLKGTPADQGCPPGKETPLDTDGDGVLDQDDPCPNTAGDLNGCPDSDGDGLSDAEDDCPMVAGPVARRGCPELTTAAEEILNTAVDEVSFHQGSYRLVSTSYPKLDEIATVLNQYPSYHLQIEGHTDNQGDPEANVRLSQRRAQTCRDYLHEQGGVPLERMTVLGYGGERPRATNDTKSGRRRNRRVEFKLLEPGDK